MTKASADRVTLAYTREGSFGVAPSGSLLAKTTVSAANADNSFNDATEDLSVFVAGQFIKVSGFTEAANNGFFKIVSAAAHKLIVSGGTLADEAAGDSVSIKTALQDLRFTGESFGQETSTKSSEEIRNDRQIPDVLRMAMHAGGDLNAEVSYGSYDDFLEAALCSAGWSTIVTDTQITFSMASGDNSINDSGSGFVVAGFAANQWVKISGFTETANNGYFKIVSVAAGKMVLAGGTVVTEAAGDSVTITMGAQIVNGTTNISFSIEREHTDLSNTFEVYKGQTIDQFSLNVALESIITGVFSCLGKSETPGSSSIGDSSNNAAATTQPMNVVEDLYSILEGMSSQSIQSLSLQLQNNLRQQKVVGEAGPDSLGQGTIGLTGTLQTYFENATLMNKYLNFTASSLAAVIEDAAGNAYIIDMPRVKYTSGKRVAGGQNQDIIADMGFTAYRHSTEDVTVRIAKFAA